MHQPKFPIRFVSMLAAVAAILASWAQAEEAAQNTSLLERPDISFGASIFDDLDPMTDPAGFAYAPSSPGDSDLGDQLILMPQGNYKPFSFRLNQQGIWTSNAGLTETDELDDFYSRSEVAFSYIPQITGNTYGEFNVDYSFFRYADNSVLDFDSLEASVGVIHVFRELNDLSAWFRYNHIRLLSARDHDELFTDHTLEVGLYKPVILGRKHLLFGSAASEFSLNGNPGFAERHEHSATFGYSFFPTDKIDLSAFYQFFVLDYTEDGRTDLLHTAGLSASAQLRQGIDLVLSGSYSINDSNIDGGDYEVGDVGASISIEVQF
ncbi:MAG: hypothetical protein AAGA58_02315 [Verrucomicrobiota bacterium]